jgi:hypothetical protein
MERNFGTMKFIIGCIKKEQKIKTKTPIMKLLLVSCSIVTPSFLLHLHSFTKIWDVSIFQKLEAADFKKATPYLLEVA